MSIFHKSDGENNNIFSFVCKLISLVWLLGTSFFSPLGYINKCLYEPKDREQSKKYKRKNET